MNRHFFILLFLVIKNSFGFKPNHQINKQTKSIFSNKKCSESFTPARYKAAGTQNFYFDKPIEKICTLDLEQYFPDVAYPTNIMEASRPYFYNTDKSNCMLVPFPDDVKSSYKDLIDKNKKALEKKKSKFINEFVGNLQENINPTPKEETIVEETLVVSKENESQIYVEETGEVVPEKVSQDSIVEQIESNDNTSELQETFEENEENSDVNNPANEVEETEVITEDYYQSWESEEIYSKEIMTQLSESDGLGTV